MAAARSGPARSGRAVEHADEPSWPRVLDVLVWSAVIILAAFAVEFLAGWMIRERIAHGFTQLLKSRRKDATETPGSTA